MTRRFASRYDPQARGWFRVWLDEEGREVSREGVYLTERAVIVLAPNNCEYMGEV